MACCLNCAILFGLSFRTTPIASALKNYYSINTCIVELYILYSFLEVPTDILNHFWIQVAVSEVKRRYATVSKFKRLEIYNGYITMPVTAIRGGPPGTAGPEDRGDFVRFIRNSAFSTGRIFKKLKWPYKSQG
jgi:hypothetical protein